MKLLICFGTRPEYIKVKSLIDNLSGNLSDHAIDIKTLFTGQHTDLLKHVNCAYKINIDNDSGNRLNDIVCSILNQNHIFKDIDYVLVQGDTTSAMAIALSAFHNNKKVIHLEAGLRTHNTNDPFPEELNRQLISRIATINLCPTDYNKQNLLNEGINRKNIFVTGNTGLDNIKNIIKNKKIYYGDKVLITMHRRDNHIIMDEWFKTLSDISTKYKDLEFIIPLHPNPNVQKHKHLLKNITVIDPITHEELINILCCARFVISDSGGLQEEASFLNKKIIVCRKTTERPETIGKHTIMCGDPSELCDIVDNTYSNYIINEPCPYGDGMAWKKIYDILSEKN